MLFGIKMLIKMMRCHFTSNVFLIFYLMIKEAQYSKPSEMYWIWPLLLSPEAHDIMKKLKLPKIDTQAYTDNQSINIEYISMPLCVYFLKLAVHVPYLWFGYFAPLRGRSVTQVNLAVHTFFIRNPFIRVSTWDLKKLRNKYIIFEILRNFRSSSYDAKKLKYLNFSSLRKR